MFRSRVGEDALNDTKCVPFVSEYSDCTEANYCSGCNKCSCTADGEWSCQEVFMCPIDDDELPTDQDTFYTAIDDVQSIIDANKKQKKTRVLVPPPPHPKEGLIVPEQNPYEENFESWFSRQKRSIKEDSGEKNNENHTVKFFHTVDDMNEDTLKSSNKTGTINAQKVEINKIPKISRRTILSDNFTKSKTPLHIEYNQPHDYDPHIAENKIDSVSHVTNKIDEKELQKLIGNHSQDIKDKDISKLVVNELKADSEIIGDKKVPPTSNITFTPENDTLTAMAFIAGNLLSKLWDMEKDVSDDSIETEVLKQEKINDLLELFKEPLSIRQETFLKNALQKLSESLNKNKNNVSICETFMDTETLNSRQTSDENGKLNDVKEVKHNKTKCRKPEYVNKIDQKESQNNVTLGVVSKLNNVLALIKRFESAHENIKNTKYHTSTADQLLNVESRDKNSTLELFGTLLDKITRLLIPNRSKSRKITNKLKNSYQFAKKNSVDNIFESKFNINLGKINMTIKDKLVLDYLNHIDSNPNCLFGTLFTKLGNTDNLTVGNILYNLSEFLKIKSFVDMIKLTNPETVIKQQMEPTTETPDKESFSNILRNSNKAENIQLSSTKDKFKEHLKAIIDDLQQLQKEHGFNDAKNFSSMDILPCISKLLNGDKFLNNLNSPDSNVTLAKDSYLEKLKVLINKLKNEFNGNLPTRRNNGFEPREMTKSAKVWERILKNIKSSPIKTRRSFNSEKLKTYKELKNIMDKVAGLSNSYKNSATFSLIPLQKRLMLLKTLEADTKQQTYALENIKKSMVNIPIDKSNEVKDFIENVEDNVKLSNNVLKNLNNYKQNTNKKAEVEMVFTNSKKQAYKLPLNSHKDSFEYKTSNTRLSRDQILNQLVINRVQLYLKSKEASGAELEDDINYNIGKRILFYIQSGNMNVAKELFKVFIANKQKEESWLRNEVSAATTRHYRRRAPLLETK